MPADPPAESVSRSACDSARESNSSLGSRVLVRRAAVSDYHDPDDLNDLFRLESLCFEPAWSRQALGQTIDNPLIVTWLLDEPDRRPASAYALFQALAGEAELLRLGVDPERRRRGLGGRLLSHGLERLRRAGATLCHLEVRAENAAALATYRRLGFETTGRRRGYYANGADTLLLARRL